jgi:mannitol-1-phosphate 5-dehydrogenase
VAVLGDDAEVILRNVQFLNTVIGKMSGVVADAEQIERSGLDLIAPGLDRAFLVEEFNRILITLIDLPDFERGIDVFVEKAELHPFEEAKLYGHNATHALVGYLAYQKGYITMSEALTDKELRSFAREAFLSESGAPLIAQYMGLDDLFTPAGYIEYVDDLLDRMANPYLEDLVERIIRDPERKLGWDDRLIGTMRLAIAGGIEPKRFAKGAAAALRFLDPAVTRESTGDKLRSLWGGTPESENEISAVIELIEKNVQL